jgi:putative phage-type endonuclease
MVKHIQGSKEWLDMRREHLGASDAPVIMGVSPWKTPLQLWKEKLELEESAVNGFAVKRGNELEPIARDAFEKEIDESLFPQVVFHKEHDFMMSSLDGLSLDGKIAVEIKCPGKKDHELAKNGFIPEKYVPQLQHQLACLGLDKMYYYSFDGESGVSIEVSRDDKYISRLIKKEREFWDFVKNKTQPPATDKDYEVKTSEKWEEAFLAVNEIDSEIKALKDKREQIKQDLIDDSEGKSCKGFGLTLIKTFKKGLISYSKIPELLEIDLEKYRGKGKDVWTLKVNKKEVI